MLARYSATDQAIVMIPKEQNGRERTTGASRDLALFFDRIRVIPLPPDDALSTLTHSPRERQTMLTYLSLTRPVTGHRRGVNDNGTQHTSLVFDGYRRLRVQRSSPQRVGARCPVVSTRV
jgi:hypothetical protein